MGAESRPDRDDKLNGGRFTRPDIFSLANLEQQPSAPQWLLRCLIDRVKCTGMSEMIGPFFRAKWEHKRPEKRGSRIVRHSASPLAGHHPGRSRVPTPGDHHGRRPRASADLSRHRRRSQKLTTLRIQIATVEVAWPPRTTCRGTLPNFCPRVGMAGTVKFETCFAPVPTRDFHTLRVGDLTPGRCLIGSSSR
jgi:hypothetical protein